MRLSIQSFYVFVVLLLYGLCAATTASAVAVEGRSSTELLWYNDIVDGSKQVDAAELLRVSINGIDSGEKLSIKGYGKLNYDLKHGGELENRLYYLYADYRGFMDKADIKLGRQFVNLSAGSALMAPTPSWRTSTEARKLLFLPSTTNLQYRGS